VRAIATGRIDHVDRTALDYALYDAEQRTLDELDAVRDLLRLAAEAATSGNSDLADQVQARTGELDSRYTEIHDRLLALIALQAPVASDLRLAIALLHVNDRLARIGAQTVNIATLCCQMPRGVQVSERQLDCLSAMTRLTDEQLSDAKQVLAARDPKGVARLRQNDLAINEHNRRCFAIAIEEGGDEQRREAAFFVALMARALERIGDNAVDIAAQAEFAANGRLRPAIG
jgi:phosphate transport system protein